MHPWYSDFGGALGSGPVALLEHLLHGAEHTYKRVREGEGNAKVEDDENA